MGASRSSQRLDQLDAVRGIASFVVLIAHVWSTNEDDFRHAHHSVAGAFSSIQNFVLYLLAKTEETGRSAVIVFFVLSGFVLALSLKQSPVFYREFLVKRFFRIYPAFLVAILISFALHRLIGVPHLPISNWAYEGVDRADTSLMMLAKTLLFWGTTGTHGLDGVDWTLVHEMRISLIFPLLFLFVVRFRSVAVLALFALSIVCTEGAYVRDGTVIIGYAEDTLVATLIDTCYFVVFFAAGAWLALERERVTALVETLPAWASLLAFVVALGLFLKTDPNTHSAGGCVVDYLRGVGSVIVIALVLGRGRAQDVLRHSVFAGLGRISYSLYLIHLPILYVFDQYAYAYSPLLVGPVTVVLSLAAAYVLAETVEYPATRFGNRLARRLRGPATVPQPVLPGE